MLDYRVIFITNNYPPVIDGVGDYTWHVARELKKDGGQVYVICKKSETSGSYVDENGVEVHPIVAQWTIKSFWKGFQKIKVLKPDCIIIQYVPYSFNRIGIPFGLVGILLMLKMKGYKLIVMFHEVATRLYEINSKKVTVSLLQLSIAYLLALLSKVNLTSIRFNAKQLPFIKFSLLPIPGNFMKNKTVIDGNCNPTKIKLGCFANRVNHFFSEVIDELLKDENYEVYFIGRQNFAYNNSWKKYKFYDRPNAVITGVVSEGEMHGVFDKLDIFLHLEEVDKRGRGGASLKNGSMAAALHWGLPVITSKGDMTDTDMLIHKKNVYIVKNPHAKESWINAVDQLAADSDERNRIGDHAVIFYNQNMSWETISATYQRIISECHHEN